MVDRKREQGEHQQDQSGTTPDEAPIDAGRPGAAKATARPRRASDTPTKRTTKRTTSAAASDAATPDDAAPDDAAGTGTTAKRTTRAPRATTKKTAAAKKTASTTTRSSTRKKATSASPATATSGSDDASAALAAASGSAPVESAGGQSPATPAPTGADSASRASDEPIVPPTSTVRPNAAGSGAPTTARDGEISTAEQAAATPTASDTSDQDPESTDTTSTSARRQPAESGPARSTSEVPAMSSDRDEDSDTTARVDPPAPNDDRVAAGGASSTSDDHGRTGAGTTAPGIDDPESGDTPASATAGSETAPSTSGVPPTAGTADPTTATATAPSVVEKPTPSLPEPAAATDASTEANSSASAPSGSSAPSGPDGSSAPSDPDALGSPSGLDGSGAPTGPGDSTAPSDPGARRPTSSDEPAAGMRQRATAAASFAAPRESQPNAGATTTATPTAANPTAATSATEAKSRGKRDGKNKQAANPSTRQRAVRSSSDARGVLAIKQFRALWLGSQLARTADWLGFFALLGLGVQLGMPDYEHVCFSIAAVLAVRLVGGLLLEPLGRFTAARVDRRLVVFGSAAVSAGVLVSVPLVATLWWLVVGAAVLEIATQARGTAAESLLPQAVPAHRLLAVDRMMTSATLATATLATVVFTALALLSRAMGIGSAFFVDHPLDLAFFVAAGGFVLGVIAWALPDTQVPSGAPAGHAPKLTVEALRDRPKDLPAEVLLGTLTMVLVASVTAALALPHVVALGAGGTGYGLMLLALAAGGLVGGGAVSSRDSAAGRQSGLLLAGAGLAAALLAVVQVTALAVLLAGVIGLLCGACWDTLRTLLVRTDVDQTREERDLAWLRALARIAFAVLPTLAMLLAGAVGSAAVHLGDTGVYFQGAEVVLFAIGVVGLTLGVLAWRHALANPGPNADSAFAADPRILLGAPERPVATTRYPGFLIALEGIDGSGKTTQAQALRGWLEDKGHEVVITREPGATDLGGLLRRLLLDPDLAGKISPRAEAMLYATDRADHVERVIRPALDRGAVVITDRYVDSTLAYQGAGRKLPVNAVQTLNHWATRGLVPDLTVVLDLPPAAAKARATEPADRLEAEPGEFHARVREGYLALAAREPNRYLVVDATAEPDAITARLRDRLVDALPLTDKDRAELAERDRIARATAERQRLEEEARKARERALAEQRKAEARKLAEQQAKERAERRAAEEAARKAEAERRAAEEAARRAEEKRRAEEEAARRAEEQRKAAAEAARKAEAERQARLESERRMAEERQRLAAEAEQRRLELDAEAKRVALEAREKANADAAAHRAELRAASERAARRAAEAMANLEATQRNNAVSDPSAETAKNPQRRPSTPALGDTAKLPVVDPTAELTLADELFGPWRPASDDSENGDDKRKRK